MARISKAKKLERYRDRLNRARRWRSDQGYDDLWRRMIDLYRGKHWPSTTSNQQDLIAVNLSFSTINVLGPAVSVNHPKVVVSANRATDVEAAAYVEAVVNYLWKHHDFQEPFRRSVKDFLIFGHGWVKVGWAFQEQETSMTEYDRVEAADKAFAELDAYAMENPEMAGDLPSDEDVVAGIPQTQMVVVEDQPFVERVSPFDIFVDPEATCMEDAQWICQRVIRTLDEVQNDKRYKASARKSVSPDGGSLVMYGDGPPQRTEADEYSQHEDLVTVWEYYNIAENTLCVFAENGEGELVDPTPMPYAYGQPFVMLRNYDVPDSFYPMGDLESIESLQLELDKTRSQLMNDRKRGQRKYLYHERSFDGAGREALESDDDGRLVPVVDENRPLSEVVVPMPQTPVPPEIYNYSAIIENDINTVSGISEYARGALPETRRTATEASIIADAQNARAADKLATIELSIGDIARRVIQLLQQYMTGEDFARIVGPDGQDAWIPYGREQIVGEFDFSVEAGSTQPMNDTIRKQQAVSLLNAVAPLVGTVIDAGEIARHVLQSGFGISDPERFIMQQQPMPTEGNTAAGGGPAPMPEAPGEAFAPTGGVPPELVSQLQNQMGMSLPAS